MKGSAPQIPYKILNILARNTVKVFAVLVCVGIGMVAVFSYAPTAQAFGSDLSAALDHYPYITDTRIDDCSLCHQGGSFSLNPYGQAYKDSGEDFSAIEPIDSDGDGFTNISEIIALTFPGDPDDIPTIPTPTNTPFPPMPTSTPAPTSTDPTPTSTNPAPSMTATEPGPSPTATVPGSTPTDPSPTSPPATPSEIPPGGQFDLDIKKFKATKKIKLDKVKPVELRVDIKNHGVENGQGMATMVGVQNGVEVYRQTIEVSDLAGNGPTRYFFPPYTPNSPGDILWLLTVIDGDPDMDEAMAKTEVFGDIGENLDLDIKDFKVTKRVKLEKVKPVEIRLDIKNYGRIDGKGTATVVGMQNGIEVYRLTIDVSDPVGNGHTRYFFPGYSPTVAGEIIWTVTLADENPDGDYAAVSTIVQE